MPIKNTQKNPYQFALISASLIAIGNYFILLLFYGYTSKSLIISILIFIISFIIIQYRIQGFLFKRFKELYQDLDMLDSTQINKSSISTDMDSLMKNIEEFTKNKKIEMEALKLKEQ